MEPKMSARRMRSSPASRKKNSRSRCISPSLARKTLAAARRLSGVQQRERARASACASWPPPSARRAFVIAAGEFLGARRKSGRDSMREIRNTSAGSRSNSQFIGVAIRKTSSRRQQCARRSRQQLASGGTQARSSSARPTMSKTRKTRNANEQASRSAAESLIFAATKSVWAPICGVSNTQPRARKRARAI